MMNLSPNQPIGPKAAAYLASEYMALDGDIPRADLEDAISERARELGKAPVVDCADKIKRHPRDATDADLAVSAFTVLLKGKRLFEAHAVVSEIWPGAIPPAIVIDALETHTAREVEKAERARQIELDLENAKRAHHASLVIAGQEKAREAGKRIGRPCADYDAGVVCAIAYLHGVREAARQCGISPTQVSRLVNRNRSVDRAVNDNNPF